MPVVLNVSRLNFPWQTKDPFLFCAHHEDFYPEGNGKLGPASSLEGRNLGNDFTIKDGFRMYHGSEVPGFPSHPHRGFETVTIALKGLVDHSDSLGAAGRFGQGDVQWMTAGKGVQHSEMFPLINENGSNTLEIFQIWLNLPAEKKSVDPHFTMMWAEDIPVVEESGEDGRKVRVRIVAGDYKGQSAIAPAPDSWASDAENEVSIWNIEMQEGSEWIIPAAGNGLNRTLYLHEGDEIEIDGETIPNYHSVDLSSDQEIRVKNVGSKARLLFLQGKPINEPVFQYGPYVMNDEEGIRETMKEYGRTQFGGWPWPRYDNVHEAHLKRFARYADGTEEERDLIDS